MYKNYFSFLQWVCYYTSINIFKHQFPGIQLVDKWSSNILLPINLKNTVPFVELSCAIHIELELF